MKYVIIADLHVQYKGHSLKIDGIPEYIYFPLLNLRKAAEYAKKENAMLIIAGDLVEEKSKLHQQVITELTKTLYECNNLLNGNMYIITGNHDYIEVDNGPVTFLSTLYGINVVLPEEMKVLDDLVLVSYGSKEKIQENFSQIDLQNTRLIISHFGLREALVGSSTGIGEFSIKDFTGMDAYLVLGHYHKPQEVSKNIIYIGSPYIVRFDEREDQKRFILFDTDTMTYKSIETEYPRYKTIEITSENDIEVLKDNTILNDITTNYHKYIFKVKEKITFTKELQQFANQLPGYIHISNEYETNNNNETDVVNIGSLSISTIADEYLEKKGIPSTHKSEYIEAIKEFI